MKCQCGYEAESHDALDRHCKREGHSHTDSGDIQNSIDVIEMGAEREDRKAGIMGRFDYPEDSHGAVVDDGAR